MLVLFYNGKSVRLYIKVLNTREQDVRTWDWQDASSTIIDWQDASSTIIDWQDYIDSI
ncbi:MAG: hypothetical protein F6K41_08945 [Symploca sp. SIO3E6]|nr:hypothetical protein [Caldora sp. SIO3E6]